MIASLKKVVAIIVRPNYWRSEQRFNGRVMVVPGISQTLRRNQVNKCMFCGKLYIWIVKRMKILLKGLQHEKARYAYIQSA